MAIAPSFNSTSGTSDTASAATKAAQAQDKLAKDMNQFLTLLTSQLKHQDPLSPMNSTEFTNQLVQFANVEQHIASNANLEKLIKLQESSIAMSSVSYIGKTIEAETTGLPLQNGQAHFTYEFSGGRPAQATAAIYNDSGVVVRTYNLDNTAGAHTIDWDGKDQLGQQMPDGAYRVNITAIAAQDSKDVTTKVMTTGTVTGVSTTSGNVTLSMAGVSVPVEKVSSIRD
ncbi:MAG: flagellar hook assembly protein FlgD [Rhodospirillales bacterium]|nr:flagellar hook assembly protein FlgD [Rhodospirillales bacterium]